MTEVALDKPVGRRVLAQIVARVELVDRRERVACLGRRPERSLERMMPLERDDAGHDRHWRPLVRRIYDEFAAGLQQLGHFADRAVRIDNMLRHHPHRNDVEPTLGVAIFDDPLETLRDEGVLLDVGIGIDAVDVARARDEISRELRIAWEDVATAADVGPMATARD